MRVTIDIDDDVLISAKKLARHRKTNTGKVLSDLVRQELIASGHYEHTVENGRLVLTKRAAV